MPELLIWIDGKLVPKSQATVSVYDHGLLYGDGCFEGIRSYGGRIFKLGAHLRRMWLSSEKIRLNPAYTQAQVGDAIRETLVANGIADGYIRLIFTRGVGTLGLNPFTCPTPGTIIIADKIQLYPEKLYREGMKIIVAKRPRVPIACLDPAVKSLNYLNNILAKIEAIEADVLEAIMLNTEGFVSECTGDNIFIVSKGVLKTPSIDAGILEGITRNAIIKLAKEAGIEVVEGPFTRHDIYVADECFLTGSAAEAIPVVSLDGRPIGDGKPGPVFKDLLVRFQKLTRTKA